LEFLGKSDQVGADVTHDGYLTHIFGLADELLFSDPSSRTEATARFTFVATHDHACNTSEETLLLTAQ